MKSLDLLKLWSFFLFSLTENYNQQSKNILRPEVDLHTKAAQEPPHV